MPQWTAIKNRQAREARITIDNSQDETQWEGATNMNSWTAAFASVVILMVVVCKK